MDYERESESIMMQVGQSTRGIGQLFLFSANMSFKMLGFIYRLAKKGLVASNLADSFKNFTQRTGGEFTVYNFPLTEKNAEAITQMQKLELDLQKETNPVKKITLRREIKGLENNVQELKDLKKLGVNFCTLPKLNGSDQTIQLAVDKKSDQLFKNYYLNHIGQTMRGGEKNLETLNVFTEGNYTILNMPFETMDDLGLMMSDFNTMGVNYSVLPDLQIGDGYTQVAIANNDRGQVERWFNLYRDKMLKEGKEVGSMYGMDQESYANTAQVSAEAYINGSLPECQQVQQEFESQSTPVPWDSTLRSEKSPEFMALDKDSNYEKITINKETLVENRKVNDITRSLEKEGYFVSRVPGTWGNTERQLVLPADRVFKTDGGLTYVGFLDKRTDSMVVSSSGQVAKRSCEDIRMAYDNVNRGFHDIRNFVSKDLQPGEKLTKAVAPKATKAPAPHMKL